MLITNMPCWMLLGTLSSSKVMVSSSPSPSPVRLSPECVMPGASRLPKKTVSACPPPWSRSTTETSRSTSPSSVSQPSPATICLMSALFGRSTTAPFSMAKAALMRRGACGIICLTKLPMVGSRMSMKCWPSCAGRSMRRKNHSSLSECTSAPTRSTSSSLFSSGNCATSLAKLSWNSWNLPLIASQRCPREAAMTKSTNLDFACSARRFAHTASSTPDFSPVCSSPECTKPLPRAFRLL
mmetsp:Transcript_112310/g.217592  ORF Transcript_112310/g.217592 Transcript_112310/m.217592 type:complete len:240 (+) Transcript_112310:377-1096(+)